MKDIVKIENMFVCFHMRFSHAQEISICLFAAADLTEHLTTFP